MKTASLWTTDHFLNFSKVDDSYYNDLYDQAVVADNAHDMETRNEILREMNDRALEMIYSINMPEPQIYFMWQPWLMNYDGEGIYIGMLAKHVWIDEDLRESITGSRSQ